MRNACRVSSILGGVLVWAATAVAGRAQCYQLQYQDFAGEPGLGWDDYFGSGLAAGGSQLLIGDAGEEEVRTYHFDGDQWQLDQILASPPTASPFFGLSIAVEGDLAAILSSSIHGTVELYRRDPANGWTWFQSLDPDPIDPNDRDDLDGPLAIANGRIFVGAAGQGPGRVFVFREGSNPGVWEQEAVLWPEEGVPGDQFGESLDAEGDSLAVGAPWMGPTRSGAVFVFERDPTTGSWERVRKITDEESSRSLGGSVALEGPDLFVSHRTIVHVYRHDGSTWRWSQDLIPAAGEPDGFGSAIRAHGGDLAVLESNLENVSSVHTYRFDGAEWVKVWTCLFPWNVTRGGRGPIAIAGAEVLATDSNIEGNRVRAYHLSPLGLGLNTEEAHTGDDLRIVVQGGVPAGPLALLAVEVNGTPFLQTLATGRFDGEHRFELETVVPPGLSGLSLTMLAFGRVTPEKVAPSILRTITFR